MKTFTYNNDLYIRCIPGKNLFKSTMIHDVVNRGDIFALRVRDQMLTIVPGTAEVVHSEHDILPTLEEEIKQAKMKVKQAMEQAALWDPAEEEKAKQRLYDNFDRAIFQVLRKS